MKKRKLVISIVCSETSCSKWSRRQGRHVPCEYHLGDGYCFLFNMGLKPGVDGLMKRCKECLAAEKPQN